MSMPPTNSGRGGLILTLGILSLVVCAPLGPIAWILGSGDLKKIAAGQISSEAKGLTQAGMICGIIGSVFLVLGLIWCFFLGGMALFMGAQGVQQMQMQP
jgi:hypothetical protein